jgi:hypothetical protein
MDAVQNNSYWLNVVCVVVMWPLILRNTVPHHSTCRYCRPRDRFNVLYPAEIGVGGKLSPAPNVLFSFVNIRLDKERISLRFE